MDNGPVLDSMQIILVVRGGGLLTRYRKSEREKGGREKIEESLPIRSSSAGSKARRRKKP